MQIKERKEELIIYCRWLSIKNALALWDLVETSKIYSKLPPLDLSMLLVVS